MNTNEFIEFIENSHLRCLIWHFDDCPLQEIAQLQPEISIDKNDEILSAIRCFVVLHKAGSAENIIPQNMIEEFEIFSLNSGYQIYNCRDDFLIEKRRMKGASGARRICLSFIFSSNYFFSPLLCDIYQYAIFIDRKFISIFKMLKTLGFCYRSNFL